MLSEELTKILEALFTDPDHLRPLLLGMGKDALVHSFEEILDSYANDLNSSTLRELVTLLKAGCKPQAKVAKLGYNGKTIKGSPCEVKPVNIRSVSGNKLNGGGNFSDLTHERLERYVKDKVVMLVSGFVDGRLIYILEFPFSHQQFVKRLTEQLERHFLKGKRAPGQYLRSAQFSFAHYEDCPDLKVVYSSPHLAEYQQFLTGTLFQFLKSRYQGSSSSEGGK